jgi:hypothetical protein
VVACVGEERLNRPEEVFNDRGARGGATGRGDAKANIFTLPGSFGSFDSWSLNHSIGSFDTMQKKI